MPLGAAAAVNGADASADSSRKKIAMPLILPGEDSACQPIKEKNIIIAKSYNWLHSCNRHQFDMCAYISSAKNREKQRQIIQ